MEITAVAKNILKLRGKNATLLVAFTTPASLPKTTADGLILFDKDADFPLNQAEGVRLTVAGPGEYEVGGIKISSEAKSLGNYYTVIMDNITMFVGKSDFLSKADGTFDYKVLLILTQGVIDSKFDAAAVTALTPSLVVLYGEGSAEAAKTLGAVTSEEGQKPVSKISVTAEKLPEEMHVCVLQ